jgi:hypothetical protein
MREVLQSIVTGKRGKLEREKGRMRRNPELNQLMKSTPLWQMNLRKNAT